jgi:cell wall-associated NlpC family hydrolase
VVDDIRCGRHRNAARYNPMAELSTIVKSAGETSVKASAVLAASGGLVAAFALPAQASPAHTAISTSSSATASGAHSIPAAAPVWLTPAVVAPEPASPVAVDEVGVVGVKAVAKPKPKPKPKPRPEPKAAPKPKANPAAQAVTNRTSESKSVSRTSTRYSNPQQSSSGVVNIARTLLGIPYVYGGSTPAGFDCSGFTQYVFRKAGISIPRTASAQQNAATPVSSPKPGDLVFFGSPAWHVGIYTGNGKMIDSPRSGKSTSERAIFSGVSGYGRF